MNRSRLDDIMAIASGRLQAHGFVCIEAEWQSHDRILRLYVDRLPPADGAEPASPSSGIDLDGCVAASRVLEEDAALDDAISGAYTLEVSSPGIERPLRLVPCFAKHVGSNVHVRLKSKVDGRMSAEGRLVRIDGDAQDSAVITLETPEGPWTFPLGSLQKASLVYDWTN